MAAVVRKLDLKRVVLVGHSMGGDVVVAAARLLKGRVVGLIWVDDYKDLGAAELRRGNRSLRRRSSARIFRAWPTRWCAACSAPTLIPRW